MQISVEMIKNLREQCGAGVMECRVALVETEGDTEKEFFCQRPLEPVSDPLLTELLEKHEVSVVRKDPPEPSSMDRLAQYLPILILLVPPVLMVIVLVYIVRINNKINQVVIR